MNEENERKFLGPFARRSLPVMSQEGGPNVERDLRSAAMDLLKRQLHGTTEETEDESQSPSSVRVLCY